MGRAIEVEGVQCEAQGSKVVEWIHKVAYFLD